MANPIRKIVQLVLDRAAAQRAEADTKKSLSGIDVGLNKVRHAAMALGAALVAALGVRKLIAFGKEAVSQAMASEASWHELAGTVANTGVAFQDVEADVRALSDAFQDATVHTSDEYADSLSRLIALTGDTSASINNMGLVANVAARYFQGNLAPAAELVSRVMTGQTRQLRRLGIVADDAQTAIEILAERSMGAAQRETETFSGKLTTLSKTWDDVAKAVGFAMIQNGEMGDVMGALTGILQSLIQWINKNADVINRWVVGSIDLAISVLDAFYRLIRGTGELLVGSFMTALGTAARGIALLSNGYVIALDVASRFLRVIGARESAENVQSLTDRIREQTRAINEWGRSAQEVGTETFLEGATRFTKRSIGRVSDLSGPERPEDGDLFGLDPMLAASAVIDEVEKAAKAAKEAQDKVIRNPIEEALERHATRMQVAATMTSLLGDEYDALRVEASSLNATLEALAAEGMDSTDERMQQMAERLREVQDQLKVTGKEFEVIEDAAQLAGGVIAGAMGSGIEQTAKARAKMNALEAAEHGVRALVASLNPFTAPLAGKHMVAAGKFAAIASAWAAFGGAAGALGIGGGGAGGVPGPGRDIGGARSEMASQPRQEVNIFFSGPDVMNPQFERAMAGVVARGQQTQGSVRHVNIRNPRS